MLDHERLIFIQQDVRRKNWNLDALVKESDLVIDLIAHANPGLYIRMPLEVFHLNLDQFLPADPYYVQTMNNLFRLPNFIIAGAQKSGTTTLYVALKKHLGIFMSTPKELHFFNENQNYERGLEWYSSFFKECPDDKIAGESTPGYLHYNQVASRIANTLPETKLIFLLRNPVDRAYSGYWHAVKVAGEVLTFERAIESEPYRIAKDPYAEKFYSYLHRGYYFQQLQPYFQHFSRSRILILIAEEYFLNPQLILTQVTDFLGVYCDQKFLDNASSVVENEALIPRSRELHKYYPYLLERFPFCARVLFKLNTKKERYTPMSSDTRKRLLKHFADSNSKLEKLLGRDLSIWKHNYHELSRA